MLIKTFFTAFGPGIVLLSLDFSNHDRSYVHEGWCTMKLFIIFLITMAAVGCAQDASFSPLADSPLEAGSSDSSSDPNAPVVKITKAPVDNLINEQNEVSFEVIQRTNPIKDVSCLINKTKVSCDWVKGALKIAPLALGLHWFEVIAEDINGLKSSAKAKWNVRNIFRPFRDALQIRGEQNAVDILFVIDNSSSMREEQQKIAQRFDRFIEQLTNINWRIAITTTDNYYTNNWNNGGLDDFGQNQLFLTSAMNPQEAQNLFSRKVRRTESGWDTETGIYSVYRSIERTINPKKDFDKEIAKFYRNDSALAVVIVSDEDESGSGFKNDGDGLLQLVKTKWNDQKKFQFNSIIVNTSACLNGEGATMGIKYEELSKKTNGIVGDICADNYSTILKDIGQGVSSLQKTYNLKCIPQDIDKDGKLDVKVSVNSNIKIPGFKIIGQQITFDYALPVGDYNFEYYCLDTK